MKKRLFSVLLIVFLMLQCATLVSAADWSEDLDVNIDMELKQSSASSFVNGPIELSTSNVLTDFRTTLEMSAVKTKFEQWYTTALNVINNAIPGLSADERNTLIAELRSFQVTGEFTIEIIYPNTLNIPDTYTRNSHSMEGFNSDAKLTFYEIDRTCAPYNSSNNKMTITIGVKKQGNATGNNYILAGELYDNRNTYFNDLVLTFESVRVPNFGTYTVKGTMQGHTYTGGTIGTSIPNPALPKPTSLRVNYRGVQKDEAGYKNPELPGEISATIKLASTPSGGGGDPLPALKFNVDGKTDMFSPIYKKTIKLSELPKPERDGFTFVGWFYDSEYKNKVEEDLSITKNTTLYGYWSNQTLDNEEHFAYIIGYPDGTVKPQNNITREEVATIFYRLLRDDARAGAMTDKNNFSDVDVDRWSNKAISTLAKGEFIKGYEDGTFAPGNYITRAEFVTMATAFSNEKAQGTSTFSDISGHWAEDYIIEATTLGWIKGYEDGTFAPGKYITRAEAMTIINRMLSREVDASGLHADTKLWSDINESDWYYYSVLEATNSHDYNRTGNGLLEKWTSINENKIWSELDEMENPN